MSHYPAGLSPVVPSSGAVAPVPAGDVRVTGGFWRTRQRLTTTKLLDHCDSWIESMGWYDAFRVAAGQAPGKELKGKLFTDADVYKLLERRSEPGGRTATGTATGSETRLQDGWTLVDVDGHQMRPD
jgi:uncharacterized protein